MSEALDFVSIPKAISGALSGAGNLQVIIPVHGRKNISFVETWDGTLNATPQIWVSNDYRDPGNGNATQIAFEEGRAKWTLINDPSIAAFLATAPPNGGKPSGAPGDAVLVMPITFAAVRWRATWVSGSGNYTLDAEVGQ